MAQYGEFGGGEAGYGYDESQRPPPQHYAQQARPMVDPEAEGEVDPNQ